MALKIGYIANNDSKTDNILEKILSYNNICDLRIDSNVDVILVIGGDGQMLHALHKYIHLGKPFYGINSGSVGFLMNTVRYEDLEECIQAALETPLYPLSMKAYDINGELKTAMAINEISIFRRTNHAAKFSITIDGVKRMETLVADGAMVSTPAGSSAYNLSAGGRILPLESNLLCLTPICAFRPRRWNGALLPSTSTIRFDIIEPDFRPVSAVADFHEFCNVVSVNIEQNKSLPIRLLFDPNHRLEDRMLKEQFICM